MKTIVGLFDDFAQAKQAALDLEAAGISHDDISIVANNEGGRYAANSGETIATDDGTTVSGHAIGHDAKVGAGIGGVAGLVLGLTGLAIPGLGWIAGAGWLMGAILGAGTGAVIGGLVGALTHVGVPHEDATHYTEGVRRGGTLLAVKATDEQAYRVAQILSDGGAVNIDERAEQYRSEGFVAGTPPSVTTGTAATTAAADNTPTLRMDTTASEARTVELSGAPNEGETVIPVVEEELAVGKREVQRGGVRVYTHVTQTPVQEQVTLREEHVNVERHPVDRVATGADLSQALQNRTLEVTETAEEAVIAKQAHVVEEVVIGKEANARTETVRDTVRRTNVDVEELDGVDGIGDAEEITTTSTARP